MDTTSYLLGKKNGGVTPTGEIDITQNGVYNVGGYATADVQVPGPNLQTKTQTISTNTTTTFQADEGYDGLSSVEVTTNIPQPSGNVNITENGTYDVTNYASANVSVGGLPKNTTEHIAMTKSLFNEMIEKNQIYEKNYYTNENITLYTPDINNQYYMIAKKNGAGYYLIWENNEKMFTYYENDRNRGWFYTFDKVQNSSSSATLENYAFTYEISDKVFSGYYAQFNTIQECIDAIQNNETTYTAFNNSTYMQIKKDTNNKIISYSNAKMYSDKKFNVDDFVKYDMLSPNETIEVIPSE